MSRSGGEGEGRNREVPPVALLAGGFTTGEAWSGEEGGLWGKHGFPHASEPKASEAAAA